MATKKQKRLEGAKRQEAYRAESKASGLRAQQRDREHRERVKKDAQRALENGKDFPGGTEAILGVGLKKV